MTIEEGLKNVEAAEGLEDQVLKPDKQWLGYDARESTHRVFTVLATAFAKWLGPGFGKAHTEMGDKVGRGLYSMIWATGAGLGTWAAASVSGISLADLASLANNSPEVIEFLSRKDGWLAFFLTLLTTYFVKKGGTSSSPPPAS